MDGKDKLKPLPKPVAAPFPRGKSTAQGKPGPVPPIDPDDFELPDRSRSSERGSRPDHNVRDGERSRAENGHRPDLSRRPGLDPRQSPEQAPVREKMRGEAEPPSFGTAVLIFLKRLGKKISKTINEFLPPRRQTNQAGADRNAGRSSGLAQHTRGTGKKTNQAEPARESGRQARLRKKRRQVYARLTGIAAAGIFVVALFVFLLIWFTGKNAYEITLGEETIGFIALSEDVTAEKFQARAVSRLEETVGARVQVDNQVTVREVNAGRDKISEDDAMIDLISRSFTYKIAATAIIVEGQEIAVLKTLAEAEAVEAKLQEPYVNEEFTVDARFVEDFAYETRYVNEDALDTAEDALLQLDKKTRTLEDYIIQPGDTLYDLAIEYNIPLNDIYANTPGLTADMPVFPGDVIKLETTRPYLSVRTIDEVKRTETLPLVAETRDNPTQSKSYTNVIQEGRAGEEEITVRITRVNGILEKPEEVVSRVPTVSAVTRIVEVGTQEIPPR